MENSRIAVDLKARTFEIDVPHDRIEAVLDRLESFFALPVEEAAASDEVFTSDNTEKTVQHAPAMPAENDNPKPEQGRKRSKVPSKIRSYEAVDLGLDSDARGKFRETFNSYNVQNQSDTIAVLGYILKNELLRSEFSLNEIHSALKIVGKPTPKNLLAVFGNMKRDAIAEYRDSKIIVNSLTEDHVLHHMQAKKKSAK